MTDIENKVYEIAVNIVPTLSDDQVAGVFGILKDTMTKLGGSMIEEQYPKQMALSYTMNRVISNKNNKFNTAYFGWVKFEMPAANVEEFKKILDRNEDIIRLMILKTVRESTLAPKKVLRADGAKRKGSKDETTEESEMDKEAVDKKIAEITVTA